MASEISKTIVAALSSVPQSWAGTIDAELQEVREVLEGLAIRKDFGDGQPCWCYKTQWDASPADDPHASSCQRARALSERLRV